MPPCVRGGLGAVGVRIYQSTLHSFVRLQWIQRILESYPQETPWNFYQGIHRKYHSYNLSWLSETEPKQSIHLDGNYA